MNQCVLNVQGLSKQRTGASGSFTVSLDRLELYPGEFCALVGPSGSGKSTLLDMLALVVKPSSVSCFELSDSTDSSRDGAACSSSGKTPSSSHKAASSVHDVAMLWAESNENALASARRSSLGYVLQAGGLFPFLSVGENIDLPRQLLGLKVQRQHTEQRLREFGLRWGYDKAVSELSGGERQRVAILRSLSHKPSLILADEPTAAVDQQRARDIVSLLRQYAQESGSAVIMVTHDVGLLSSGEDRQVMLEPVDTGDADQVAYQANEVGNEDR